MGGQTVPEAGLDKPFVQSEPKDLRKKTRIKLKSYDFHACPGCHRVVRNNQPGKIRPGPKKDSDPTHPKKECNSDAPNRMEAQKRGEPKENAQRVSEGCSLRGVLDMEKLFDQIFKTAQTMILEKRFSRQSDENIMMSKASSSLFEFFLPAAP